MRILMKPSSLSLWVAAASGVLQVIWLSVQKANKSKLNKASLVTIAQGWWCWQALLLHIQLHQTAFGCLECRLHFRLQLFVKWFHCGVSAWLQQLGANAEVKKTYCQSTAFDVSSCNASSEGFEYLTMMLSCYFSHDFVHIYSKSIKTGTIM